MKIEYDHHKNQKNQTKHGVAFEEAASCLDDPNALVSEDKSALGEQRFVLIGMSASSRLLVVVTAYRGDTTRIISAWRANKTQKVTYEIAKN